MTFELPVFTFFLVRLGIWNYRLMLSTFRYALIVDLYCGCYLDADARYY